MKGPESVRLAGSLAPIYCNQHQWNGLSNEETSYLLPLIYFVFNLTSAAVARQKPWHHYLALENPQIL